MSFPGLTRLCVRAEVGHVYEKSSMVEIADGGTISELLCKVTSKCDTSLLLLTSHKGKLKGFTFKLLGLQSPQSSSISSAVVSGIKKGLSFLQGNSEKEPEIPSDDVQVAHQWNQLEKQGCHGMQVVALVDKEMMPDNHCRQRYDLYQFMAAVLGGIESYYMFQKPHETPITLSECSNPEFLRQEFPNADTFAIGLVWILEDDPRIIKSGRMRATPIVNPSVRSRSVRSSPKTLTPGLRETKHVVPSPSMRPISKTPTPLPPKRKVITPETVEYSRTDAPAAQLDDSNVSQTTEIITVETTTTKKVIETRDGAGNVLTTVKEMAPKVTTTTVVPKVVLETCDDVNEDDEEEEMEVDEEDDDEV